MANTKIPVELSSTPGIVDNSNATAITIDSSENVGIGTNDPTVASGNGLAIYDSVVPRVQLRNSTSGDTSGDGAGIFMSGSDLGIENRESSNIIFYNNTEKMRIDSSGNLLVGKTATGLGNQGAELSSTGQLKGTAPNQVVAYLNRTSSDGTIAEFRKDNSTVGSIGANGNRLQIQSGSGGDLILGTGSNADAYRLSDAVFYPSVGDATADLGLSNRRFKDLYLSGGAYIGGTGAANKLDDYEEGTWTVTVADATSGGNTATADTEGKYTKIGNLVTVTIRAVNIATGGMTSGNALVIRGLPFTSASGSSYGIGSVMCDRINFDADGYVVAQVGPSVTYVDLRKISDSSSDTTITVSDVTASGGSDLLISLQYNTTA